MRKYRIYDWKRGGDAILVVEAVDAEDACERASKYLGSKERACPLLRKPVELGAFMVVEGAMS